MPDADTAVVEETAAQTAAREAKEYEAEFYSDEPTAEAGGKPDAKPEEKVEADPEDDAAKAGADDAKPEEADDAAKPAEAGESAEDRLAKVAEGVEVSDEDAAADAKAEEEAATNARIAEAEEAANARVKEAEESAAAAKAELAKTKAASTTISLDDIPTADAILDMLPSGELKRELEDEVQANPETARLMVAVATALSRQNRPAAVSDDVKALQAEVAELKAASAANAEADAQYAEQNEYASKLINGFTDEKGVVWKGHADAAQVANSPEFQEWLSGRGKREQKMATMADPVYSHMLLDAFAESEAAAEMQKQAKLKGRKDKLLSGGVSSTKAEGAPADAVPTEDEEFDAGWDAEEEALEKERKKRREMRTV